MVIEDNLEVLVSTMHRSSLDFIDKMFLKVEMSKINILIINQTTDKNILTSNQPNIRVINAFDTGLSKSRNLALANAKSKYILIADDDLVYEGNFYKTILDTFKNYQDAALITFEAYDDSGSPMRFYPEKSSKHDYKSISKVSSIEIAFNLETIKKLNVSFNEYFGLGSTFQTGEEQIFARAVFKHQPCYFVKQKIVQHPYFTSGRDGGSDRLLYARAAIFYKKNGALSYLKLIHYVFLILKKDEISWNQVIPKLKMGLKGISSYKALVKQGFETR